MESVGQSRGSGIFVSLVKVCQSNQLTQVQVGAREAVHWKLDEMAHWKLKVVNHETYTENN